jgi:hypothetical protein
MKCALSCPPTLAADQDADRNPDRCLALPSGHVLAQREMEKRRSPLVSDSALRAGIFKAWGSIVRCLSPVSVQRGRRTSRAAEHRLNEPTGLSLSMVASPQCPLPFRPARSL